MDKEPKRPHKGSSLHNRVTLGLAVLLALIIASGLIGVLAVKSTRRSIEDAQGSKAAMTQAVSDSKETEQTSLRWIAIVCGLGGILVGAMSDYVRRSIRKPLRLLREGSEHFAAGDLQHRIPVGRNDELGQITEMFNTMASALAGNQQDLAHQAFHDPLTDLPNRDLFTDRVEHALARQEREQKPLAVLFVDLDDFKTVNDSLGHAAGDELLTSVAERLLACVRPSDTAARLGGDEFAVLLEELRSTKEAHRVAQRIIQLLEGRFLIEGKEVVVRASVGIAITYGDVKVDALLRNADVAMYAAKNQGKGRYEVFDESMHVDVLERMELKAELESAVERNEFVLFYEPLWSLEDRKVVGAEALIRWKHPTRGILPSETFLELAEETGLIFQIGDWAITDACRQLRWWQQEFNHEMKISINLSPRQVRDPGFVERLDRALKEAPVGPSSVMVEITENLLMHDADATALKLKRIKELGVSLAIGDFGTRYSSLGYLKRFPIDAVKIDRSFTEGVAAGPEESAVARALVKLGDTFGLKTIPEGIRTPEQVEALRRLGCAEGQGELVAGPLPSEQLEALMDGRYEPGLEAELLVAADAVQPMGESGAQPPPPPPPELIQ